MTERGGFQAEYAKTGRSSCKGCGSSIAQGKLRIGKESPSVHHDGWDLSWYHLKCSPRFQKSAEVLNFEWLRWKDQEDIRSRVAEKVDEKDPQVQRHKQEVEDLWDLIAKLEKEVPNKLLKEVLEANGIQVDKMTPSRLLHKAADGMLWGRVGDCPECSGSGCLRYTGFDYKCKGWFSEFTRCTFQGTKDIKRYKWKIPSSATKNNFLKAWKPPKNHPTEEYKKSGAEGEAESESESEDEEELIDESIKEDKIPEGQEMYGMNVMILGTKKELGMTQSEIKDLIEDHGGEVDVSLMEDTRFVIAPESELKKKTKAKKLTQALAANLPVFSVDYITELCEKKNVALREKDKAKKYLIGGKLEKPLCLRYNLELIAKQEEKQKLKEEKEEKKKKEEEKKRPKAKKKLQPLPGCDLLKVDPDSELDKVGEILVVHDDTYGYTSYNVMLNQTDLHTGVNKFYRMQVIKRKGKNEWNFWTSWGRIGTDRGSNGLYTYHSQQKAIDHFAEKFKDCTGVNWSDRNVFQKQRGRYFMVSLDDGHEELSSDEEDDPKAESLKSRVKKIKAEVESKKETEDMVNDTEPIPTRVQNLVQLIFDKEMMSNALKSMDIDINKMPLGKISKKQIKQAYGLMDQLQNHLALPNEDPLKSKLLTDISTQFYTLVPHDFGGNSPPVINTKEMFEKKVQLLDTLCDIEIAAALMKTKLDEKDPIRQNYDKLHTKLTPLDKSSDLYKLLEKYAYDSHDSDYFPSIKFEVEDIFEVQREGESERFAPWAKNDNRMLLWHGSRLTNWVGILSTGLRIAPPEAPKTGYRFGKGVYLADVITKSASYCYANRTQPTCCMLLAESALGRMNQLTRDEYMEKAPQGTDSTKALGKFAPSAGDHNKYVKVLDNVTVPQGRPLGTGVKSTCSHNEYIIYDVSQILIRYLFRIRFKF